MDNDKEIQKQAEFLYDVTAKEIYNLALYTIGNPVSAEQIAAEAFCEAFYCARDRTDVGLFRRKALKKLYRYGLKKKTTEYSKRLLRTAPKICGGQIALSFIDLDFSERYMVLLFCWLRLSPKEISKILYLPIPTVKEQLYKSIRKIRAGGQ